MKHEISRRIFLNGHDLFRPLRIALAIVIVVSMSGCWERLAQKHEFYASAGATNDRIALETERLVAHYTAVQAARRECARGGPAGEAWTDLCGMPKGAYAVHGARFNGHRRWVEDKVRKLPEPSDTASSVGGGS